MSYQEIVGQINELNSPHQEEPEPEIDFLTEMKPISFNVAISCMLLFGNANNISIFLSAFTDLKEKATIKI